MLPTMLASRAPALTLAEAAMLPALQGAGKTEMPKNLLVTYDHLRFEPAAAPRPRTGSSAGRSVLHIAGIILPGLRVR